jgi:hypothetical protein
MISDVLPLRAVLFQFLFLMIAIAIDSVVYYRNVETLEYKPSVQYAATANLFSTCLGWLIFFGAQPFLPLGLREQLISFIFFGQFFINAWSDWMPQILLTGAGLIFCGTVIAKLVGLNLLERLLEKEVNPEEAKLTAQAKRLQRRQAWMHRINPRREFFMAVLRGCGYSFSAILLILCVMFVEKF